MLKICCVYWVIMAQYCMQNMTPIFPGFHLQTLRRKPRLQQQIMADEIAALKQKSFSQLGTCFGRVIPHEILRQNESGAHSRNRIFNKENTFWAFFSQVLDADGGCMEIVKKLKAYTALKSSIQPSTSTGSYCKARAKLSETELKKILDHTAGCIDQLPVRESFDGRRVVVVDGTGISMPDTPANQEPWPQSATQKKGCGFPTARVCACFSLETGHLLSYEIGNKKSHELRLLRKQYDTFNKGDIFLGDKGFCSYFDQVSLQRRGVDSVVTLARRTPVSASACLKQLKKDDLLIYWKKPLWHKRAAYTHEEWCALPDRLVLRQIKVTVNQPGFRVKSFYIVTTLTDHLAYPAEKIAELYFTRWHVELNFRDIKTTLGMDILRCKTPSMIRKELLMYFIVYNAIRGLMYEAAEERNVDPHRISFKGALQSLRQWAPNLNQTQKSRAEKFRIISLLYDSITQKLVPYRPGRREPRCLKRRPKTFQLLTAPRHEMKEIKNRAKYRAKPA